jgi:predicted small integral membrane protein
MTVNEGKTDRILRALAGAVLLALAFLAGLGGTAFWVALAIGVVMLATAATGFCPAYRLLGLKTCKAC